MNRVIVLSLLLLLITYTPVFASVIEPARLSLVSGNVMIRTPDAVEFESASVNTPFEEGDDLWCPDGTMAEVQLPDGSVVRLDGGSQLNLLANEDSFIHLYLASGRLYLRTSRVSKENALQIDADDTTVLPSARTRLRLDMLTNGQEDVSIFKGSAYVEGNGSRTKVRAGEHIALEEDYNELLPLNPPDNWERWNMERDRVYSKAVNPSSNLPDELSSYSGELAANGTWVSAAEYGMVWRPTVIMSNDWVPYGSGRWIWRGADYVWVPAESWGWVPYHYGRWTVIGNFGWCWIPPARGDVYWGPGYVGWYRTGSHVGWIPLAPRETYYGYGKYGRYSVDISTTTVNVRPADYRNRRYGRGLTVVPQNDFLRGRIPSQSVQNSSVSVSVAVGSPRIKPPRDERTATVRQGSHSQAFPRREQHNNSELRQRFPRVTPEPAQRPKKQLTFPVAAQQQRQQPQRTDSPPVVSQQNNVRSDDRSRPQAESAPRQGNLHGSPDTASPRVQQPQGVDAPSVEHQQANGRPGEKNRQVAPRHEQKQKKVWRVRTEVSNAEKPAKGRENRNMDRDRKEKQ